MPRKDLNVEDSFLLAEKILQKVALKTVNKLESHFQGNYRSIFQGQGLDFKEIREYSANDDVRTIDWNVTARTGNLHVRVYEEERDNTVWLVLDVSPSMDFGSFLNTKKEIMVKFAALISYLSYKKGDKTGAILFDEGIQEIIPPEKGIKQVYKIIKRLLEHKSEENGATAMNFSNLCSIIGRKKSVFFMSDFVFSEAGEKQMEARSFHLRSSFPDTDWEKPFGEIGVKNELTVVQIIDPVEEKIPDVGYINLYDPETGREIVFDSSNRKIAAKYQELLDAENAAINEIFSILRLEPVKIYTNSDIADVLIKLKQKMVFGTKKT